MPQTTLILYYHSVADDRHRFAEYVNPGIVIETDLFREHMQILRERFHPVGLDDVYRWVENGENLPPRSVVVTFDDGFADNYDLAAPVMEEYDVRGTFYLTTHAVEHQTLPWFCKINYLFEHWKKSGKAVDDPVAKTVWRVDSPEEYARAYRHFGYACAKTIVEDQEKRIKNLESLLEIPYDEKNAPKMMDWDMANDLARRGHTIGNHTHSHPNVAHLLPEDQRSEIERSHALLRKNMAIPVEHFFLPASLSGTAMGSKFP